MSTAIARIIDEQRDQFLAVASVTGIEFEREKGFALQILRGNDYLAKIAMNNPDSLRAAITNISAIGISLNPASKQAYLVPRDGKVCLDLSYMGLMHIAQQCGAIQWGQAVLVREGDQFEMTGLGERPIHKYSPFDKERNCRPAVGAYCVVKTDSGDFLTEAMSIFEIEGIRDRSPAWKAWIKDKKKCPWVTDEGEMIKKGLALDTKIPTPSGWTTMGDIAVGDSVFDRYGKVVSVTDLSEVKEIKCFKVEFSNGESIVCDDEHRWVARSGGKKASKKPFVVMSVNEMHAAKMSGQSVTVPIQGSLELPDSALPIDPYLFGYWIGDGTARRAQITCSGDDLDHVKSAIVSAGYKVGSVRRDNRSNAYSVGITDGLLEKLRETNVLQNKHIPQIYLRGSIRQRKALLAGLLDSDGHLSKAHGRAMFCSTDEGIAKAVYELASSLGETPWFDSITAKGFGVSTIAHNVIWRPSFCCFTLSRKAGNYKPRKISQYRSIKSIEVVNSVPTCCIAVTGETSTYLAGAGMIPTHNTVIKRASKTWPRRERLDNAIHYLNTDGGEGIQLSGAGAAEPRDITPASPDQQIAVTDTLREIKKEFSALAPFFNTKYKSVPESVADLTAEQAVAVLAFIQRRAA